MDYDTERGGKVPTLEEKKDAARRAEKKYGNEIQNANDSLTPEDALIMGTLYIIYSAELDLYLQEEYTLRQHAPRDSGGWSLLIRSFRNSRLQAEKALFLAQKGDYTDVKTVLAIMADQPLRQKNVTPPELPSPEKLRTIAEKIPANGVPLKPPLPAWENPEFQKNSENEQSLSK